MSEIIHCPLNDDAFAMILAKENRDITIHSRSSAPAQNKKAWWGWIRNMLPWFLSKIFLGERYLHATTLKREAEVRKLNAETENILAEANLKNAEAHKIEVEIRLLKKQHKRINLDNRSKYNDG